MWNIRTRIKTYIYKFTCNTEESHSSHLLVTISYSSEGAAKSCIPALVLNIFDPVGNSKTGSRPKGVSRRQIHYIFRINSRIIACTRIKIFNVIIINVTSFYVVC